MRQRFPHKPKTVHFRVQDLIDSDPCTSGMDWFNRRFMPQTIDLRAFVKAAMQDGKYAYIEYLFENVVEAQIIPLVQKPMRKWLLACLDNKILMHNMKPAELDTIRKAVLKQKRGQRVVDNLDVMDMSSYDSRLPNDVLEVIKTFPDSYSFQLLHDLVMLNTRGRTIPAMKQALTDMGLL